MVKLMGRYISRYKSVAVWLVMAAAVLMLSIMSYAASHGVQYRTAYGKADNVYAKSTVSTKQLETNAENLIKEIKRASESGKTYVYDMADILTDDEETRLEERCRKASANCKTDIVIITMETGKDYDNFDDFVRKDIINRYFGYSGTNDSPDAIVYGIDMVSRADRIITSGKAQTDISQSALDSIREDAEDELADGYYYDGCVKFIKGTELSLNESFLYEFTLFMPVKLLIAAVLAVVSVLLMMISAKSKMTVNSATYMNNNFKILGRDDRFINTTTRTRTIESNSGGSGGGNSGSSGGHF